MAFVPPADAPRSVQAAFADIESRLRKLESTTANTADDISTAVEASADELKAHATAEARKASLWNPEFDTYRGGAGHAMGALPSPNYRIGRVIYPTSDGEWAPLLDGALESGDPGAGGRSAAQKVVEIHGSLAVTGALQADNVYCRFPNPKLIGCHITHSANQNVASSTTATVIACDTTLFDTHGFHSNTTNNSRITIPAGLGGYYLVSASVYWSDVNDSDSYRSLMVQKNSDGTSTAGNAVLQTIGCQGSTGADVIATGVCAIVPLIAGDRLEMFCQQVSGTTIAILGLASLSNGQSPLLQVMRLGW